MNRNRTNGYHVSLPDNLEAFYAYVNLVINNKNNSHKPEDCATRPKNFGPVINFEIVRNEVGERFLTVYNIKDCKFLEMLTDQFTLIRTYFNCIEEVVIYPNSDIYDE